mgnify:CR=1 FL=1
MNLVHEKSAQALVLKRCINSDTTDFYWLMIPLETSITDESPVLIGEEMMPLRVFAVDFR